MYDTYVRYIIAGRIYKRVCECNDVTEQYLCYAWIAVDCGRAHASLNIIPHPTGDYIDYGMIPPKRSVQLYRREIIYVYFEARVLCVRWSFRELPARAFPEADRDRTERSRCILLIYPEIGNPYETNPGESCYRNGAVSARARQRERQREEKIGTRRHVIVRSFEQDRWYIRVRKWQIYRDQVVLLKLLLKEMIHVVHI